jgi:hypothetical protein
MGVTPERQFELKAWRHLPTAAEQEAVHRFNLAALMLKTPRSSTAWRWSCTSPTCMRDRMPRRRLAHTDILARSLPRVRCPVHAIYGAHDALYKAWIHQLEDAFEAAAPDFRGLVLIPEAGHWVPFERPEAFDEALLTRSGRLSDLHFQAFWPYPSVKWSLIAINEIAMVSAEASRTRSFSARGFPQPCRGRLRAVGEQPYHWHGMNWVETVWIGMCAASLALGAIHLFVWFKQKTGLRAPAVLSRWRSPQPPSAPSSWPLMRSWAPEATPQPCAGPTCRSHCGCCR